MYLFIKTLQSYEKIFLSVQQSLIFLIHIKSAAMLVRIYPVFPEHYSVRLEGSSAVVKDDDRQHRLLRQDW